MDDKEYEILYHIDGYIKSTVLAPNWSTAVSLANQIAQGFKFEGMMRNVTTEVVKVDEK